LRNAEHNRGKHCKQQGGTKVGQFEGGGHGFFPIAM
jgi:hypothetical protein